MEALCSAKMESFLEEIRLLIKLFSNTSHFVSSFPQQDEGIRKEVETLKLSNKQLLAEKIQLQTVCESQKSTIKAMEAKFDKFEEQLGSVASQYARESQELLRENLKLQPNESKVNLVQHITSEVQSINCRSCEMDDKIQNITDLYNTLENKTNKLLGKYDFLLQRYTDTTDFLFTLKSNLDKVREKRNEQEIVCRKLEFEVNVLSTFLEDAKQDV